MKNHWKIATSLEVFNPFHATSIFLYRVFNNNIFAVKFLPDKNSYTIESS